MLNYTNTIAQESKFVSTGLSGDEINATSNGTVIDRNVLDQLPSGPYEDGFLLVELESVNGAPTSTSVKFRLEESADNVTWSQVTDLAKVEAQTLDFTEAGIRTLSFRLPGLKRYVRPALSTVTLTGGTTPSVDLRVTLAFTNGRQV